MYRVPTAFHFFEQVPSCRESCSSLDQSSPCLFCCLAFDEIFASSHNFSCDDPNVLDNPSIGIPKDSILVIKIGSKDIHDDAEKVVSRWGGSQTTLPVSLIATAEKKVVHGAQCMFLWVRLVLRELEDQCKFPADSRHIASRARRLF